MPFLKGKKAVWIDCRIHAADSKVTFTVEKARYDDMPLPAFFVEKMIQLVAARQARKVRYQQARTDSFRLAHDHHYRSPGAREQLSKKEDRSQETEVRMRRAPALAARLRGADHRFLWSARLRSSRKCSHPESEAAERLNPIHDVQVE